VRLLHFAASVLSPDPPLPELLQMLTHRLRLDVDTQPYALGSERAQLELLGGVAAYPEIVGKCWKVRDLCMTRARFTW
jgi:hypothetical protein